MNGFLKKFNLAILPTLHCQPLSWQHVIVSSVTLQQIGSIIVHVYFSLFLAHTTDEPVLSGHPRGMAK